MKKPVIYALAALCCLFWAGAYVTGKVAIGTATQPGFGPFKTAFLRFGIAGTLLLAWGLWRDPASLRIDRADWPRFGRLALLGMCLTYTFNYAGLPYATSTAAALIIATEPVWIVLLAVIFLKERMTLPRGLGSALGLIGTLLVVISTTVANANDDSALPLRTTLIGCGLIVLSLLWESSAVLFAKRLTGKYPGRVVVTYEFTIGAVLLAPFALWEATRGGWTAPTPAAWWAFLYLVGPCTLLGYTLWYRLMESADASELSVFLFLQPVVGTILGVVFFGDPFTVLTGVGALLVLGGVGFLTRSTTEPHRADVLFAEPD